METIPRRNGASTVNPPVGDHSQVRPVLRFDDDPRLDAQASGERLGVGDRSVAREPRRHQHAVHLVGAERIDGDRSQRLTGFFSKIEAALRTDNAPRKGAR